MKPKQLSAGTPSPAFGGVVSILQRGTFSLASLLLILLTATVAQAATTPAFVQEKDRQINVGTSNSVAFSAPTTVGNLIVVYLIWDNTGSASVADSLANSYVSAAPATTWSNGKFSAQIFYAVNARSGADTVTGTFGTAVKSFGIVYAHEYSGIAQTAPLDVTVSASGSNGSLSSGTATTTNASDLLFAGGVSANTVTAAGTGYIARSTFQGNITEDRVVSLTGSYSATASHSGGAWGMQLVAFKGAGSGTTVTPPSITVQPSNQSVTAGQPATFSVTATGSAPLGYQWQKNGVPITGANSASYTTPATTASDNGASFLVVVTNSAGSASSSAATLTVNPTPVTLQSLAVTPANPSIFQAQTQQFTATGTYSDASTKNITASVTWASSNTAVGTVGATTGLATGVSVGATQITATLGSVVSPSDTLTVNPVTLQSIAVTPANPSILPSQTQQFTATGTYNDGSTKNITTTVAWASSNLAVATVGATTGLATGVSAGTAQITATLGAVVSPGDTLTVNAITLQSIATTPSNPSIFQSQTQQFTATGNYNDGSSKNITAGVAWASSNPPVATVDAASGLATGVSAGTTQITATQGTVVSPGSTLTANLVTLQSIVVSPLNPSISPAQTQQFIATGTYNDGSTKDITTTVTWASSSTTIATIGANTGLATGVAAGISQITATLGIIVSPADPLTVSSGPANSYTTNFSLTENPISEAGKWINGKATGLDWADVRTTPGLAFGGQTATVTNDDSTAVLTGTWGPGQTAQATVFTINQDSTIFEEVELRLRTSISAHSMTGYEINFRCTADGTQYAQIVRWNGPFGNFTLLDSQGTPGLRNGDVVTATAIGSTISAYINGVRAVQVIDTTYTNGSPGIGFYIQGGTASQQSDFGFTSFTASDGGPGDLIPPSVPANLAANVISASEIDLSWSPSTDNVAVAGYHVIRNNIQIANTTAPSFADLTVVPGTPYTYIITAFDVAGNTSPPSSPVTAQTAAPQDPIPPSVPANLQSSNVNSTSLTLTWSASTDNVAVTGYGVFRNGVQVGTPTATTFNDTQLQASTSYSYTVAAFDAAGNVSAQSQPLTVTTAAAPQNPPTFVQVNNNQVASGSTVSAAFRSSARSGNTIVAYVIWNNTGAVVLSDSSGNSFVNVGAPLSWGGGFSAQVFYATRIAGGADTITATFRTPVTSFGVLYVHEYAGIDPTTPVDVTLAAIGSSATLNSGAATTTSANDLIFGAGVSDNTVTAPGTGFASRDLAYGNITEDRLGASAGPYAATASHNGRSWGMQLVAFRAAAAVPSGIVVTVSPKPATVVAGLTQQFTATVSNTTNTAVTWQVNGVTGGNSTVGTISASGLYTAPATVPSGAATVTAISQADNTKSDTSTVTISLPPVISVTVNPPLASVVAGTMRQFTATVTNTSNTAVTWQVNGATGGDATHGTISTAGLFTAPAVVPSPATVTVSAISQADNTKSGASTVTVTPALVISVTVSPATPSVALNATQQFTATVTNTSNTQVTWQVNGVTGGDSTHGTINASGLFTAPAAVPSPATVTVTAISQADNTKSGGTVVTITAAVNVTVTVSPKRAAITTGQSQTFVPTVLGSSNTNVTWEVDTVPGGNPTVGTITAAGVYTPPASAGVHTVVARSVANTGAVSPGSSVAVTDLAGVYTYHNDLSRDGVNAKEYALTTSTVAPATFGKLFSCPVDGAVYAQPLWVANVNFAGVTRNVLIAATQHDTIYAFDADANPCTVLWSKSLFSAGETWLSAVNDVGCEDLEPDVGIVGTPVIDPATNTIYVVSKSKNTATSAIFQRIHALDLATGTEKFSGPTTIAGSVNGNSFDPQRNNQRPGLALVNGKIYIAWASHCDAPTFQGWVFSYTAADLTVAPSVFTPAGHAPTTVESGIWMSGGAPAADASNNVYLITGNGTFDANSATPPNDDYGDSFLKLSTASGISVADYFTPSDFANRQTSDQDLGSGGAALLVDQPTGPIQHLLIGGGKGGILFLLNRDNMGQSTNSGVQQFSAGASSFSTPVFWQNHMYFAGVGGNSTLQSFTFDPATPKFVTPAGSQSSDNYNFPGATPSLSASGTTNGIVWALRNNAYCTTQSTSCGPAILRAYDATNVATELWHSDANVADAAGNAVKFTVPTVANGKVYVGTRGNNTGGASNSTSTPGEIDVYGLKPN